MSRYIELHAHSYFSLLDGASSPEALIERAVALGMPALALTDHDSLGGVVRFWEAANEAGIKPIFGAELTLTDGTHLTLLARNRTGYANISRLVSFGHYGQEKGESALDPAMIPRHSAGIICLSGCAHGPLAELVRQHRFDEACQRALELESWFDDTSFYIELQRQLHVGDRALSEGLLEIAREVGLPVVATGNVHYAEKAGARLQDILVCIRNNVTLPEAGTLLCPNAEGYLHSADEMAALFADCPDALENSVAIADACNASLNFANVGVPAYPLPDGENPDSFLRHLCEKAFPKRYKDSAYAAAAHKQLDHELDVIARTELADYFLVVYDIMAFAKREGIMCQGRGSAANSVVCYLLGITAIEPLEQKLLFERFLSVERHGMGNAMPDIDIDFERTRREEVIQYVYRRYGWAHTAMACTLVTYHTKSAVRDVGKALGFAPDVLAQISKKVDFRDVRQINADRLGDDLKGNLRSERWQTLFDLCRQMDGLPRHLSIHSGGMIVTRCPLIEVVPLEPATMEGRVVTQWDKDSLEAVGLIKIDILSLAMLAIIGDAKELIQERHGVDMDLSAYKLDDPAIYDLICKVDTVGIFQVESRAQAQMIPQMQPREFNDLVTEVALVRPGPIGGGMVGTYIRRRRGQEPVRYQHPSMAKAVGDTLGVIIFQEQVLQVATAVAGFSPGDAEMLRRAMGRKRAHEAMENLRQQFTQGAMANGVPQDKAHAIYDQLSAFAAFGFNRAHAASFALLSYVSGWLKLNYPLEFYVGWLNNQPAGFYSPDVLVEDARRHGIDVLPVDINRSLAKCAIEDNGIRLGLEYIHGCGEEVADEIIAARTTDFLSLDDLCRRVPLGEMVLENLIMSGACDMWGGSRRQLLWRSSRAQQQPLLIDDLPGVPLPALNRPERLAFEHTITGVASSESVTSLFRPTLIEAQVLPSYRLDDAKHKSWVRVGGVVVIRQHPPTAKGFTFISLRDEWGHINLVLRPDLYQPMREVMRAPALIAEGVLEKRNGSINVKVETLTALQPDLTEHPDLVDTRTKVIPFPGREAEKVGKEAETAVAVMGFRQHVSPGNYVG